MRLTRANQEKEISPLLTSVLNPSMGVGSTQSPSDEAYMGGFTMWKPYGLLIEGLEYEVGISIWRNPTMGNSTNP